mmetsp:Transcript_31779/g.82923  ORF Transcript_31779/g.82923 Transcript_31779/m.82923 type:complete len:101 (-) Transcript_31779:241-543(-)
MHLKRNLHGMPSIRDNNHAVKYAAYNIAFFKQTMNQHNLTINRICTVLPSNFKPTEMGFHGKFGNDDTYTRAKLTQVHSPLLMPCDDLHAGRGGGRGEPT